MKKFHGIVQDTAGNGLSGVSITIYLTGTSTLTTIYSDDGVTTTTNPLTTDSYGRYSFYISDGDYKLTFSGSTVITYSLDPVTIVDTYSLSTTLSSHASNITNAHSINLKADISGEEFTGDIGVEKSKPAIYLRDSGTDGVHWRIISEYGVLKFQLNLGDDTNQEWWDALVFTPLNNATYSPTTFAELIIRVEVKGQFRTDIRDGLEPDTL